MRLKLLTLNFKGRLMILTWPAAATKSLSNNGCHRVSDTERKDPRIQYKLTACVEKYTATLKLTTLYEDHYFGRKIMFSEA